MRVFSTQSMWDIKEGKWYEVFSVDGESCSGEEYFRELEVEQCLEDDYEVEDMDEIEETSYCMCCECKDNEDCPDFECTCCDDNCEVENGNTDGYLEFPCQCDDCCESRGEFDDEECFCQECNQEREEDLIDQCVEVILNGCTDCAIKCVVNTLLTFKKLGKLEMKQEMKDFLED